MHDCLSLLGQAGDEGSGRVAACQSHPLACPERQIVRSALPGSGIPEWPCQRILQRERENGRRGVSALHFGHEAVDDPPSWAPREGTGQTCLMLACPEDGLLIGVRYPCLVAAQESCTHLHRTGAERQRGSNTVAIHDATRRDHGHRHGINHLRY